MGGSIRAQATVLLALGALLLGGCLLSPGKFASTLDLRKGGAFTYTYDGEIHLLALSKLAEMGAGAEETFVELPCYSNENDSDESCTAEEIAQQRRDWEAGAAERKARKEADAQAMRAMLGGIDPADPAAAEELAARLRRQVGWKRVDSRGEGLFEVSFALTGRIGHDFQFPTLEGFPASNVFVSLSRRSDGTVRVNAPGFAPQAGGNPFQGMMGALGGVPVPGKPSGPGKPDNALLPKFEGTFTITTDGEILANNTDEGPAVTATGKALRWAVNTRTKASPTALIRVE